MSTKKKARKVRIKRQPLLPIIVPLTTVEATISSASMVELPVKDQYQIMSYLRELLGKVKESTLTFPNFIHLALYVLMFSLATNRAARWDTSGELARLGRQLENTATALDSLGDRIRTKGKYLATGNEIAAVEFFVDYSTDLLGLLPGYMLHHAAVEANKVLAKMEHKHSRGK